MEHGVVTEIAGLQAKALALEIVPAPQEPGHVYYLRKPNGDVERVVGTPPRETPTLHNLDSLAEWGWAGPGPKAWVSLDRVCVVRDDPRQSYATFPVGVSPQLATLTELAKGGKDFDQRGFVRLLKTTFDGCVPSTVVEALAKVRPRRRPPAGARSPWARRRSVRTWRPRSRPAGPSRRC